MNTSVLVDLRPRLRISDGDSTLLVLGDIFSVAEKSFSGPNDPELLPTLMHFLKEDSATTWSRLIGQCTCVWITQEKTEVFRSAFSPHLVFYSQNKISDRLINLVKSSSSFSDLYARQFVLDFPSLQFSSSFTPFEGVFRAPPSAWITFRGTGAPEINLIPQQPYGLIDRPIPTETIADKLRDVLKTILKWHLQKGTTIAAELSGGLDSSFVASFLADLSSAPIDALMYAYRKHPSHLFSEDCAKLVARDKNIRLKVYDSSEVPPVSLDAPTPYQNEPVDLFWQGTLFGPICREFIKTDSLLFTGFGCDQLLMRSNQILQALADKRGVRETLSLVRDVARALNRPANNFTFQFFLTRLPEKALIRLLDLTRNLKINPFKVDELLPSISHMERISWWVHKGAALSPTTLFDWIQKEATLETAFFEPGLPHPNLNYLVAPQYVIQPYLELKHAQYLHPFCDFRMIDFVYKEVPFQAIHDFKRPYKFLLREAMRGITPEQVRIRPKDEFSFDGYFFSVLKTNEDFLRDLLQEACRDFSDWIDPIALNRSFDSMLFGLFSNSETKLARLLSYLVWRRNFRHYLNQPMSPQS